MLINASDTVMDFLVSLEQNTQHIFTDRSTGGICGGDLADINPMGQP
jgi:hypothetical protein